MILNDICELIVDCPHSTAQDEGAGYPLIRTPNIGKGRLNLDGVHRVSKEVYDKRNARAVPQDDDLILAREAPAGNVAIIKNGEKVCLGQRVMLIRCPNGVLVDYLKMILMAPQTVSALTAKQKGIGAKHVNVADVCSLVLPLPPTAEQKRIIAKLGLLLPLCRRLK